MKYILFVGHFSSPFYKQIKQLESNKIRVIRVDPENTSSVLGMHFDGVFFDEWINVDYFMSRVRKEPEGNGKDIRFIVDTNLEA